ncbi:hypothetical protein PR048_024487 [Dryococelus australis]|uniref:Retrovirus-related Pol polyprotein from transposon TNT 1-94-like beta-barrel domain-containing protein n=1 Tax=Dryococelus australis TaxID=614101 RepID=A0ABQ9GNQ2_9NEOP|nr:hypothetical protein PR048_024487 [Dryococelus australis]
MIIIMHGHGGLVRAWNKGVCGLRYDDPEKLIPKQRTRDTDALNFVIQVVGDQYLNDLDQCARAKTAWEILENIHCNFGILRIITMLEEFVTIKKKDNKAMREHGKDSILVQETKSEVEYENTALDGDSAVATAHFKALCANKPGRSCTAVWILDSGATRHMTPYRELIEDFDGSQTGTVKLANGESATTKVCHLYVIPRVVIEFIKGKMKRIGFTDSVSRTSAVLELVNSGVVGKITPPSIGGTEYFVTLMDDYSRYSEVKVLKKKI